MYVVKSEKSEYSARPNVSDLNDERNNTEPAPDSTVFVLQKFTFCNTKTVLDGWFCILIFHF